MQQLAKAGKFVAALSEFDKIKYPKDSLCAKAISLCRKSNNYTRAKEIFEDMVNARRASIFSMNSMMTTHCHFGRQDLAIELFKSMEQTYQVKPDCYSYLILMTSYNRKGKYVDAEYMWDELILKKIAPSKKAYTAYITSLAGQGKMKEVLKALDEMRAIQYDIDDTMIVSLYGALKQSDMDSGTKLWMTLLESAGDFKNKTIYYNFMLENAKTFEEGLEIYEDARKASSPSPVTFTLLLQLPGATYEKGLELFEELKANNNHSITDIAVYNSLLFLATNPPVPENEEKVNYILGTIPKDFRLPLKTFEILISYYFAIKENNKINEIKELLKNSYTSYTPNLYAYIIEHAIATNDPQEFLVYLNLAIQHNVRLHVQTCYLSLYTLAHTRLFRPFSQLFKYMITTKIVHDRIGSFFDLMHFLNKDLENLYEYVFEIHRIVIRHDLSLHKETYWEVVLNASTYYKDSTKLVWIISNAISSLKKNPELLKKVIEMFLGLAGSKTQRFSNIIDELRSALIEEGKPSFHVMSKLNLLLTLMRKSPRWDLSADHDN